MSDSTTTKTTSSLTSNHWGIGVVESRDGRITRVSGHPSDPRPSVLNDNIVENTIRTTKSHI